MFGRLYSFRDPSNACLFGLRVNECYLLDYLAECGPASITAIAKGLGVHKSNASRIASTLQKRGLVEEAAQAGDGRLLLLHVTKEGAALHERVRQYFVDRYKRVLANFSPDEIDTALRVLARLSGDAEERIAGSGRLSETG